MRTNSRNKAFDLMKNVFLFDFTFQEEKKENGTENADEKESLDVSPDQKQSFPIYPNGEKGFGDKQLSD